MKLLWSVMLVLALGLQFRLWVGEGSFAEASMLESKVENQVEVNQALIERNARLDAEVQDLRSGLDAIEERARSDLGMIGPDETVYVVVSRSH